MTVTTLMSGGITYLLRDTFGADVSAGSLNGTAAAGGKRHVTDVENKIFTLSRRLRGGGQDTPVWGESKVAWSKADNSGWSRVAGRTLASVIVQEDPIVSADIAFGWASTLAIGDPRTDGVGYLTEDGGEVHAITPGTKVKLYGDTQRNIFAMQYLVAVPMLSKGAAVLISTFGTSSGSPMVDGFTIPQYPQARVLWVDYADTDAEVFPYVQYYGKIMAPAEGYPNGNSVEDVRVFDVAAWKDNGLLAFVDEFTRADSASSLGGSWTADNGTWGISSNKAYPVSGSGWGVAWAPAVADAIFQCSITVPPSWNGSNAGFGMVIRRVDANNYIRVWNNMSDTISIQVWQSGGFVANILNTGKTWVAGQTYRITVITNGNRYKVAIDGAFVLSAWTTDSGNYHLGGTGAGPYVNLSATYAGARWDDFLVCPYTVTLPNDTRDGKVPDVLTGGSTLGSDTFNAADHVDYNGTSSLINCGSGATLDNLADNEFTFDMWIRNEDTTAESRMIIDKGALASVGWGAYLNASGGVSFTVTCATTSRTISTASNALMDYGWHHVAGYFNDAGDRKLYLALDGVWQTESASSVGAIVSDAAQSLVLGRAANTGAWYWLGGIGWVRLSNNDRYSHGSNFTPPSRTTAPTPDANTVELWTMNQASGTTATAAVTAPTNNGTITAGTWALDGLNSGATSGPAWQSSPTDWNIVNGSAFPDRPSLAQDTTAAWQDIGTSDAECQVDITTPSTGGSVEYFGGVAVWVDGPDYLFARLVRSDSLQPGNHEIELGYVSGSGAGIRHKIALSNFYAASTTYTMKVQTKGDLMHVFLNGAPMISYYRSAADPHGTGFGIHDYYLETGCTFDNWSVKAL